MEEKMAYKLLIVGGTNTKHIRRMVRRLREYNPKAVIDCYTTSGINSVHDDVKLNASHIYVAYDKVPSLLHFPILRILYLIYSERKAFKKISSQNYYDVVSIHYPQYNYRYSLRYLRQMTRVLSLCPWGSDVYRISKIQKRILQRLYDAADVITIGAGKRFHEDTKRIFSLPEEKFKTIGMGSESIDYIIENDSKVSVEDAKKRLNVAGRYVITCGYNCNEGQQHDKIIDGIIKVREQLPKDFILFFPLTYGGSEAYKQHLKQRLDDNNLPYMTFESYMTLGDLFIMQKATDILIHIQLTDANNATIKEYILLEKKVLNAGWISYQDLMENGKPSYFIANSPETVGEDLVHAIQSEPIAVPKQVKDGLVMNGWNHWIKVWDSFFSSCMA